MLPTNPFFSSISGSPTYLASSQQHLLCVTLFASGHPPGVGAAPVTEPPTSSTGASIAPWKVGDRTCATGHREVPTAPPGCCSPGRSTDVCEWLQHFVGPPDLGSRGRKGGAANAPPPGPVLRVPTCIHRSIPAAPRPQVTPPVLHRVDKSQLMAGTFCPLCLSRALLWP